MRNKGRLPECERVSQSGYRAIQAISALLLEMSDQRRLGRMAEDVRRRGL